MRDQSAVRNSFEAHVSKILDALGSNEDVRSMTKHLVKMAEQYGVLESTNPLGEAAGLVYIAGILTNNPVTLATIGKKAGVSSETVRKFKTQFASELKTKDDWPGLPPKGK
jgi:transcription initiation factor TFIIIB Brf1 subunit/transcription initiation factor TFIIB